MNEIQLSDDLNVITAEINSYKQVAGQSIFEIGRRLKHVKENDLVHGEFGDWLESIDMTPRHAQRFIKIFEELPNTTSVSHLGIKALYEIATLPQEEREKEHTTSNGETKAVDEMTVRELQEVKKKLKQEKQAKEQAEQQAKQAKQSEEIALKQLEEMEDKETEVVEKEVIKEVVPDDYNDIKENYQSIKGQQEQYKKENEKLQKEIEKLNSEMNRKKAEVTDSDMKEKEKEIKLLQLDASKSVLKTKIEIDEFLQKVAVTSYRRGAIATSTDATKNKLKEGISDLKNFINEMEMALDGTIEQ